MIEKHTILLIDDDKDDLMLIKHTIMEINNSYILHEVENGNVALEYLHDALNTGRLPCLVLLDINMPVLDGKQFLEIIKADDAFAKIPIVVLTTSANTEDENFCKKYDVEMLTKPFKMKLLFESVKQVLSHCRPTII
jgi:CheY-like chemotaxis protein